MREKGRQRERASERASERAGRNEGGKERRERDVTGEWTTGSHTQSNTARKPAGYLTYCTPPPRNSPQLRNIIALWPRSRPRVLPIPRRILPFTTPGESRNAGWTLRARARKTRGRIDVDVLNSAGRKMSYLFYMSSHAERICPRESGWILLTIISKVYFLISI